MKTDMKMNTVLAKQDHSTAVYNKELVDYINFFKKSQGAFRGESKTHVARDGYVEDPSKMGVVKVQTTVDEKFNWFSEMFANFLKDTFTVEATNSLGANKVELKVDGVSFGELTALDLMRLKNILSSKELISMFESIPVRSDSVIWNKTQNPEYEGRNIYETPLESGVTRTTETEEYILKDPNIDPANIPSNYHAAVVSKRKTIETGDYTRQLFTGEWTQRQKAELLKRRSKLYEAVNIALKEVNDITVQEPNLDINALINYIIKK